MATLWRTDNENANYTGERRLMGKGQQFSHDRK